MPSMITNGKNGYQKIAIAALVLIVIVFPLVAGSNYLRSIATKILMYCVLASSLNVINGYSGQFTLGHVGFVCIGAYTLALLTTRLQCNYWLAMALSGIFSAVFGLIVSFPTRKLSGMYLSIVTMGFAEILRIIFLNWSSFTGGALGIKGIATPSLFGQRLSNSYAFYYIIFVLLVLMLFCTSRVLKSRVGRAWISIRENPVAAASLGVNMTFYKSVNIMYGAFWAGIIGAYQASYYRFIDTTMFSLDETFNILTMNIIGGMGTIAGPLVGSLIMNIISEVFRFASEYRLICYAILIIVMMWVRPQGLMGTSTGNGSSNSAWKRLLQRLFSKKDNKGGALSQ